MPPSEAEVLEQRAADAQELLSFLHLGTDNFHNIYRATKEEVRDCVCTPQLAHCVLGPQHAHRLSAGHKAYMRSVRWLNASTCSSAR